MNSVIQDTLLDLFQQVIKDPESMPAIPTNAWSEGSQEWYLLIRFRTMLERMQQHKREAEEQLREKEAQYRAIFEVTSDGLFINDLEDGRLVEVNPAACKMHDYSYEELLALHPLAFIHSNSHHLFAEYLQTVKAGEQFHARAIDIRKDGTAFPVEVYGTPFTHKGRPHLLGVVRDITEQIQAEEQLREQEEQYRSVFEASTDAMTISSLENGTIVEVNPATCKMFGYTHEEMIGIPPSTIVHPDSHSVIPEGLHTIQAGGQFHAQVVGVHKDGTSFPIEAYATPFMYKGKPHSLSVARDISERVEAEKQLREKEEQYRSIFEATYDAINILDLDGFFVEVNPAFCNMFGCTREELIGVHASSLITPVTLPILADALNILKTGKDFHAIGIGLRKDGTTFYAESQGTLLTYKSKPHILSISRDITEQVQAQQLLEQRVEKRTRELSSLLEISHTVASTLHLKPLLGLILDQLKTVVEYTGASILIVEGEELVFLDSRSPIPEVQLRQLRFPLQRMGLIWEIITSRESILVQDVRDESPMAQTLHVAMGELMKTTFHYVRACLFVPLTLKDHVIGMLVVSSQEPHSITSHHATLALAVANQAAIAIENARLYEQARALAALEERQKLARELHDSVSQALYGISLGAHAARTALERDPSQLAEPLDYVLALTEAALAEMRALIFELRPESLETEGLVSALTKQAAALHARYHLEVSTELCEELDVSLKVKQDLYRIAQEALHNTVKHAHARKVNLRLEQMAEGILLEMRDDGIGFDTTASFPGHLGLHSMRERVMNMGGRFEIESGPDAGTRICVHIPGRT